MNKFRYFYLALFLISFDQIFKYFFVVNNIYVVNSKYILGQVYFSKLLYFILVFVFVFFIIRLAQNATSRLNLVLYLLICSGVISNFLDRLLRGFVVDYINLTGFVTVNLADVYIFVGVLLLVIFDIKGLYFNKK